MMQHRPAPRRRRRPLPVPSAARCSTCPRSAEVVVTSTFALGSTDARACVRACITTSHTSIGAAAAAPPSTSMRRPWAISTCRRGPPCGRSRISITGPPRPVCDEQNPCARKWLSDVAATETAIRMGVAVAEALWVSASAGSHVRRLSERPPNPLGLHPQPVPPSAARRAAAFLAHHALPSRADCQLRRENRASVPQAAAAAAAAAAARLQTTASTRDTED